MNQSAAMPEPEPPTPAVTPARPTASGSRIKILVVDRDPRASLLIQQHCRAILAHRPYSLATADSLPAATARLGETAFDVILLDPELPRGDGLELLSARPGRTFQTIIVSAHTGLSLRAFDYGVLDFVPKPVSRERLAQALHRVAAPGGTAAAPDEFLAVRHQGRIDLVAVGDLVYAEGADKYSELVFANGQRTFHDQCLGRLEATLPSAFVRIHKSYLVRFNLVARLVVRKGSRYFAELRSGQRLPVGRSRYARIKARLLWPPAPRG
jgi:DNA-binding LytR/AlgR family response regulator